MEAPPPAAPRAVGILRLNPPGLAQEHREAIRADALTSDDQVSRAVICVPSTILQVAAEFYFRPRPIEVAASGPHREPSGSRATRIWNRKPYMPAELPLSGLFNPEQPGPGSGAVVVAGRRMGAILRLFYSRQGSLSVPAPVCSSREAVCRQPPHQTP